MSAQPAQKSKSGNFYRNSYEATLTPKELERFHALLRSDKKIVEMRAASIPWRKGRNKGQKPCLATIYEIRARLDLDDMLHELEGAARFVETTKDQLEALVKGTDAEKMIDQIMVLIGHEIIHRTLKRLNPAARTAAAKLLLKRADQRRVDRRLDMVEAEFKKKDAPTDRPDIGLTPEEKQQRMKEILRIN